MMDSLRNAAKSWVAKVLIGLLAVSFGVWGIADVFRGYSRGALARVGGVDISGEEFSRAFSRYLQDLQRQTGQVFTPEDARKFGLDRQVLNNLIQTAAVDNQARGMGLAVSDAFIAKETADNPAFHDNAGKFDPQEFRRRLDANGMNEATYLISEREGRLREAITGTVDGSFQPPRTLVEASYRFRNEQRDARYFVITTADSEAAVPSDEQIKKEYEAHPEAYTAPEYRSFSIMKAEPADIAAKVTLNDQDLADGYAKYKGDYFTPEKRTILQLSFSTLEDAKKAKDRLTTGEDFMKIAKDMGFSETDVTFADKVRADFIDKAIADAAFGLAEGTVSEPIKGGLSTVLLKAVKVSPEHQRTLDEVKAELGDRLKLERAHDEISSIYAAVEDARAAQTKFEDIAAKASIPFQLVNGIDAAGNGKDGKDIALPHKPEVLKAIFSSDVGVDNDAISVEDGYVWYDVREVVPSAVKPFDTVKDQAKAQVIAAEVLALAESKAKALVEKAKGGASIEDLARDANAEIKTTQGLKRNETSPDFEAAAVKAIFAVGENGFAYALEPGGKGARIMQSQAVLLPPFDAASSDAKTISGQLQTESAGDLLTSYLGELQKAAGVKINETLWQQISGTATQ